MAQIASHDAQRTSVRGMNHERSSYSARSCRRAPKSSASSAGIEFGLGQEQRRAAAHACKCQSVSLGVERIGECALGAGCRVTRYCSGVSCFSTPRPISRPCTCDCCRCPFLALLNPARRNTWVRMHRQPESLIVRTDGSLRRSSLFDTSEIV